MQTEPTIETRSIHILYIEDNPNDFILVKRLLKKNEGEEEQFEVELADRVANGLDRLAKGGIDLVLTDLNLPDTQKLEAVTKLLTHFPLMPIIALTNAYAKTLGIEAVRKGAQDYLLKDELNSRIIKQSIRYAIERKRLEKLKSEFVSSVSHELLTPLTIMKGGLDNLSMGVAGEMTAKQREILASVCKNIDRLSQIVKNILDISRLESGHVKINLATINLTPLIHEVVTGFHKEAEHKQILIEENTPNTLEVLADPNLIIQVLNNLLSNACRFAKKKIFIMVQLADQMAKISIIDDGSGIAAEDQKKLFNKFEQINRPEGGPGYKGTGLGLAICKEIVELHEGNIWVESSIEHGSRFCFTLPLKKRNL